MFQCKTPQSTDWWDNKPGLFIPIPPVLMSQALPDMCTLLFFQCRTRQYIGWLSSQVFIPIPPYLSLRVQCQMYGTEMDFYFQFNAQEIVEVGINKSSSQRYVCYVECLWGGWSACVAMGTTEVLICHVGRQRVQEPSLRKI